MWLTMRQHLATLMLKRSISMSIYNSTLEYYVYAYLREDGTPYYIGKGKGKRLVSKNRRINKPKEASRIIICESSLTELGAFALERRLIRWHGRKDNGTGILHNLSDGGEGNSGLIVKEETRKKLSEKGKGRKLTEDLIKELSESRMGKNNPMFGRKISEDHKRKISENNKARLISKETRKKISEAKTEEKHHFFGRSLNEKHKQNISNSNKGKKRSDETKLKISGSKKGKQLSEDHKRKLSESHKGKKLSIETRKKMSAVRKGKKRYAQ